MQSMINSYYHDVVGNNFLAPHSNVTGERTINVTKHLADPHLTCNVEDFLNADTGPGLAFIVRSDA